MAKRNLTYIFASVSEFVRTYETGLSKGGLFIGPERFEGELAKELRLDLVLPNGARVGPLIAQVVHTAPDGGVGVRIQEMPDEAKACFEAILKFIAEVRDYLVQTGQFFTEEAHQAAVQQARADAAGASGVSVGAPQARPGRGIPVPDVRGTVPALKGNMSDRSLRDAMVQLAVEQVTGMLTIRYPGEKVRYGFWDRGGPVGWRIDPISEEEVLGVLLYKAKQLSGEQVKQSLEIMEQSGLRQGEALVQMGVMTYPQLIMVLGKQNEFVLQRVMTERKGDWEFHLLPALPEQFLASPIKVPSLLFRALYSRARDMNSSELYALQQPMLNKYVSVDPEIKRLLTEIKFLKKEAGLIEVVQASSWRVRELFTVSPMSRAMTSAVIWALDEMKVLVYEDTEDLMRYLERVGGRISRKKAQVRDTFFNVLELHWVCLSEQVVENHRRLKEEFKAGRYHDLTPEQLADLGTINNRLDEALAAIEGGKARRVYRAKIIEKDSIFQSAQLLANKAEMAIMRRDRKEAINCFAKAIELMPGDTKFRDGLQRAQGA
jgi:hypothetical protein